MCQRCDRLGVINTTPLGRGKLWHLSLVVSGGVCWWQETTTKYLWQVDTKHRAASLFVCFFGLLVSLIFLFVPCGRLSWLHVSFLLHVKYTVSYRIVSYQLLIQTNIYVYLISGNCQVVENTSLRLIVVAFSHVLFLALELLQRVFHPHHRVVEIAFVVRYPSQIDAVLYWLAHAHFI